MGPGEWGCPQRGEEGASAKVQGLLALYQVPAVRHVHQGACHGRAPGFEACVQQAMYLWGLQFSLVLAA